MPSLYPGAVSAITRSAYPTAAVAAAHAAALRRALPKAPPKVVKKKPAAPTPPAPPATRVLPGAPASSGNPILDYYQSLFGTTPDLATQQATASAQAQRDLAAMTAPYLLQQQRAAERAAATADLIRQGSSAIASSLEPLGKQTSDMYANALGQLQGFSQGYTGQIAKDYSADAAANQATFDKLNMPATATNLGEPIANTLYTQGGVIPATPLVAGGAAATAAANVLPTQIRAGGEQQVNLSNLQAATQQQDIGDQILALQSQLPTLTQQYLTSTQEAQQRDITNRLNLLQASKPIQIGSASTGYQLVDPFTYKVIGTIPPAPGANMVVHATVLRNGQVLTTTYNKLTGKTTQKITGKAIPGLATGSSATPYTASTRVVGNKIITTRLNKVTGKVETITQTLAPGTQLVHTPRGGVMAVTVTKAGKLQVTDTIAGEPVPYKTVTYPDGTFAIGVDKTGTPFEIKLSGPKVPPPKIFKNTAIGGYDVFNNAGVKIRHIPGTVAAGKPTIKATPRTGGYDVFNSATGKKLFHIKGPPQTAPSTAGQATFADINRVQTMLGNATRYSPPKYVAGHQGDPTYLTVAGHDPEPYQTVLNKAINANPRPTKAWVKRVTEMVNNQYGPVLYGLVQRLHQDPSLAPLGLDVSKYTPETLAQVLPGYIYANLLNGGFPEEMARAVVLNEFGLTSGQLAIRIEAADAIARSSQVKKPKETKSGKPWWNAAGALLHPLFPAGGGWLPFGSTATASAASYTAPGEADTSRWPQAATMAYTIGMNSGMTQAQAIDFAGAQKGESGFDPTNYFGRDKGNPYVKYKTAGGLYQLLSKGYVDRANALGGIFNPEANIRAILPEYLTYYRNHPNAAPGEAAAAVEQSGEGASYYAPGTTYLRNLLGGGKAVVSSDGGQTVAFHGPIQGVDASFMEKVSAAARSVGATRVVITSGKRSNAKNPGGPENSGAPNSNHLYGHALDGYAVINGKKVPLGIALQPVVGRFGLRSGNVKGFYPALPGGYDPSHVDDGYNQGWLDQHTVNV